MQIAIGDGRTVGYDDVGAGERTLVLMHGLGSTRKMMAAQVEAFSSRYRIVNVDLRGHGASSKPDGRYHPDDLADDIADLCRALELRNPIAIGHSIGGVVGLQTATRHPGLLTGLIALDAAIAVPLDVVAATPELVDGLARLDRDEYETAMREVCGGFFAPYEDQSRRAEIIDSMVSLEQRTFLDGWLETVINTDTRASIQQLTIPTLYIGSEQPLGDLAVIRAAPMVTVGQTIGCGHFHHLECAEQVNAMIARFLFVNGW